MFSVGPAGRQQLEAAVQETELRPRHLGVFTICFDALPSLQYPKGSLVSRISVYELANSSPNFPAGV